VITIPLYDYKCECGFIEEKLEFGEEIEQPHPCPKCGKEMERLSPKKVSFKLKYNNKTDMCSWGNEGYDSSRYWDEYKKAKERGEDVKPADSKM
jgi:putative FmdB family regulatory protein